MREDSDVVGNVIIHTNPDFGSVVRVGGDGSGQSKGRVRFVNNTFVLASGEDATVFRIFDGIQSVEMHNNVIDVSAGGTARIERTVEAVWTNGRQIHGSNNWIEAGSSFVPGAGEWSATLSGSNPGFTNAAAFDFTPLDQEPQPAGVADAPLAIEGQRAVDELAAAVARGADGFIDIGAFEALSDLIFAHGFE